MVLTGTMSDGAAGLCALKECGGLTVIQDPADAAYAGMPQAALRRSRPDRIAPLSELPKLLQDLVQQIRGEQRPAPAQMRVEVAIARGEQIGIQDMDSLGSRSTFTCPDCGGVLWEIEKGGLLRYRCHLGHAYTAELVGSAQEDGSRDALSKTLRALRERLLLARRLEGEAVDKGWEDEARYWRQKLEQGEEQFAIVADALQKMHETSARTAED
ncbi:hypothetical protein LMG27198_13570 [Methylocystis echinoides]|uniref:protein-glutamate methylesterase n=1 Tax=Methylocystis echinoides TaxID=29468 RepID=A0A9W6GT10_9HYPH|nr:hypothetical protein LMG27198_13570 [Methylocystis echinoides]